jgi:DNA-binding transcriptional LysR family regulator
MLALRLLLRMERSAPNIKLEFSTQSRPDSLDKALLEGKVDVAVDWLPAASPDLAEEIVVQDELVVVARRGHAALKASGTLKSLGSGARYVSLRPRLGVEGHPLEAVREWMGAKPRVLLRVSEFIEVLVVVAASDILGVVPMSLAKISSRALDIQVVPAAKRLRPIPIRMAWRKGRSNDPAHRFLRDQLRVTMKEVIKP